MNRLISSYLSIVSVWLERHRSAFTLIFIILLISTLDIALNESTLLREWILVEDILQHGKVSDIAIDFAPEVWLALLGLVLGTLIIVISIASQSTPKLIDLYIGDQTSLMYIWFITSGAIHNLLLQLHTSTGIELRGSSMILNTYILLPLALFFAIPYVLYILKYTKTSNVIDKIFSDNLEYIERLKYPAIQEMLQSSKKVEDYQLKLFDTLNQLDDLLEYVAFKEPKGDIINKLGKSVRRYTAVKSYVTPSFFKISPQIRQDISFKTMTGQFERVEKSRTFYEQKAFRLLGNAYQKLLEKADFDLASLCAYELSQCGKTAIKYNDDELIQVVLVRFNTLLRFGIKHGLRYSEVRNLYNAAFHYSDFIMALVESKKYNFVKISCNYLKIYGSEIYRHSRKDNAFIFLVDVFALEMQKILIKLCDTNADELFQRNILDLMLQMDNLPETDRLEELDKKRILNDSVRVLQVALAAYYIHKKKDHFVDRIVADILEDLEALGEAAFRQAMAVTISRLEHSTPHFWEDTDRGNSNIYYTPFKDEIKVFVKILEEQINRTLRYKKLEEQNNLD
jgi:hypothetical protein